MVRGPDRDVKRADVLEATPAGRPVTTGDIAEELPCSRDTVYNRLKELHELDDVQTKKVGARARVWWKSLPTPNVDASGLAGKDATIIDAVLNVGEPVTSPNVSDLTGINKSTVYDKLDELDEDGWLVSMTAGANARVWWVSSTPPTGDTSETEQTV